MLEGLETTVQILTLGLEAVGLGQGSLVDSKTVALVQDFYLETTHLKTAQVSASYRTLI